MGFGIALEYETTAPGENNLTRGMPPRKRGGMEFDKNGQPKYFATRNHPRLLQGPHGSAYFGANNDTQILLYGSKSSARGMTSLEARSNNLVAAGVAGLANLIGAEIAVEYCTG